MSDIFDYLNWRGDISFDKVWLTEADYLTFCSISYIPFDGVVESDFHRSVSLGEAAKEAYELVTTAADGRRYTNKGDDRMLLTLQDCPRFAELKVCGYENIYDKGEEEQFSAITFMMPGGDIVVAYRGTDSTVVGWKEDFNMAFMAELPAQLDAVAYIEKAAAAFDGHIYVCGHSKGGNLAMYAASFCSPKVQERIVAVRNMDGPGFNEEVLSRPGAQSMIERTQTFVPQSSVVGMLLAHSEPYHVVHSTNVSLMQHYLYSWQVRRGEFVGDDGLTDSSQLIDETLKDWLSKMTPEHRGELVDAFYGVIMASDANTLSELVKGKSTLAMLKAFNKLDPHTKAMFDEAYRIFKASFKKSLPIMKQIKLWEKELQKKRTELVGANKQPV